MANDEFVRVPSEPTEAMIMQGALILANIKPNSFGLARAKAIYKAMLAAAPPVEMEQQVNFSVLLVEKNERRNCERSLSQLLATNKLLRAALGESNGVLDAFSTQSQTAKYQLEENRKLLAPPESAQTEGAIVAWRKDNYEGKPIAITVEDLATQPEFVKELWKDAQPLYTICQCPQCGAGKEGNDAGR